MMTATCYDGPGGTSSPWSPAASSGQQRERVLPAVKGPRYARPPLRGADALDAGSAHARSDWPLTTMPSQTLPAERLPNRFSVRREVVREACAVLLALVPFRDVNYRKALQVSSLYDVCATLDLHRTQRNNVGRQHQDRGGPRNQDHVDPHPDHNDRPGPHGTRNIGAMRSEQSHRRTSIPTTRVHPIRATAADDNGAT